MLSRSGRLPFDGLTDKSKNELNHKSGASFIYGSGRGRKRPDPAEIPT